MVGVRIDIPLSLRKARTASGESEWLEHKTATVLVTHAPHQIASEHRTLHLSEGQLSALKTAPG